MPFGPPSVGKTALYHRLVDKTPPGIPATRENYGGGIPSTDFLEIQKSVQIEQSQDRTLLEENGTWQETHEEAAIWTKTVAERKREREREFSFYYDDFDFDAGYSQMVSDVLSVALKKSDVRDAKALKNSVLIYYTDTGGQPEFQEVLPAFVVGPTMFLLVFNLLHGLKRIYNVTYQSPTQTNLQILPYSSSFTVEEVLMQCLSSIASYRHSNEAALSVSVVGTHKDLVKDEEVQKLDEILQRSVKNTLLYDDDVIEYHSEDQLLIPVNNYSEDNDAILVRNVIKRVIKKGNYSVQLRTTWLALQLCLQHLNKSLVSYEECQEIAKKCNICSKELPDCLFFLHNKIGTIRYYTEVEELRDIVIVNPGIIFKAINELITSTFNIENVSKCELDKFKHYGLLKESTVAKILDGKEMSSSKFLALLKHLCILGPTHDKSYGDYFLPCALVHIPEDKEFSPTSLPILISFEGGFVPKGIFSSMLAFLCQNKWRIQHKCQIPQLYRNQASFYIGSSDYIVTIKATAHVLEIYVANSLDETHFCQNIRDTLQKGLQSVCSVLKYNKSFAFGFYCELEHESKSEQKHVALIETHNSLTATCKNSNQKFAIEKFPHAMKRWFFDESEPSSQSQSHDLNEGTFVMQYFS